MPPPTKNIQQYKEAPPLLRDFLFYMLTIRGRSAKTVEAYYIDLRTFLRYVQFQYGNIPDDTEFSAISIDTVDETLLQKITLSDVYSFLNYTMSDRSNSPKTRARKVSSIRSFFKYLTIKANILSENPVKDLELPATRKSMPKYLTLEECLELLNGVSSTAPQRDTCILTLFLNCGMRLSELVGINLADIRGNTLKLLGKGNKERIVYLNDACLYTIEEYQKVRVQPQNAVHKDALFLSSRGTRLSPRRVEQIVEECLRNSGLSGKGYSPHKLRHTAATLMYQHGGVDIRVLKEILGHTNLATTEIYTHISDKQIENAANASPLAKVKVHNKTNKGEA